MHLLSMSPIVNQHNEGDFISAHSISFDTKLHIPQLQSVFSYFHTDVHEWYVCQIAERSALNKRIVERMDKPRVGCCNQKFLLQVNRFIATPKIKWTIDSARPTMRNSKASSKNRAILHRLKTLSLRWSALSSMVNLFLRIHSELQKCAATDGADLTISRAPMFKTQCML